MTRLHQTQKLSIAALGGVSGYYCPTGAKGLRRPAFCGGRVTPKSVKEANTGSVNIAGSSLILPSCPSVAKISCDSGEVPSPELKRSGVEEPVDHQ